MNYRFLLLVAGLFYTGVYAQQPDAALPRARWTVNEQVVYAVSFTTAVKTDFAAFGAQTQDTSLNGALQGTMHIICKDSSSVKWYFYAAFPAITHCRFPLSQKEQAFIQESLQQGFYFSQFRDGIIDSVWFPRRVSDAAEHLIIQLLEHYQYYLPTEAADSGWQQVLPLTDGPALATFSISDTADCSGMIKLTGLAEQPQDVQPGVIARSNQYTAGAAYCFRDSRLQELNGWVVRQAKINHKTITTLTNVFHYVLQGSGVVTGLQFPAEYVAGMYGRPIYYPGRLLQKLQESRLVQSKSISIAGLLKRLEENELVKDVNLQDKLAGEIQVCLLAEKDSLYLIRQAFMQADVNSISFKTLRTGIVTASTAYAQEMISDYLSTYKSFPDKLRKIIPSAGLVRAPLPMLQKVLESFAFDTAVKEPVRASAALALGNIAGSLRLADSTRANALTRHLGAWLQPKGDDMLLLSVMGNCGTRHALPYILPLLSDSGTAVRGYAYYALRFIQQPLVDSLYQRALLHEKAPEMFTNVFNALFLRGYSVRLTEVLYKLVQESAVENTRLEALQVLFEWSYRQPMLLEKIRAIATDNSNSVVRKTALQFLARADQ